LAALDAKDQRVRGVGCAACASELAARYQASGQADRLYAFAADVRRGIPCINVRRGIPCISHRVDASHSPTFVTATEAEADVVRRMGTGEVVPPGGYCELLKRLSGLVELSFPPECSVRAMASPFAEFEQDHDAFFVDAFFRSRPPPAETVSVRFRSAGNCEVWWDPNDLSHGVCARPMHRRYNLGDLRGQKHGYRGKQYTLVVRQLPDGRAAVDSTAKC
jgi:hypothetical protein